MDPRIRDDSGQDIAEYAILAALIAVVVAGTVSVFGDTLVEWWTAVSAEVGHALAL